MHVPLAVSIPTSPPPFPDARPDRTTGDAALPTASFSGLLLAVDGADGGTAAGRRTAMSPEPSMQRPSMTPVEGDAARPWRETGRMDDAAPRDRRTLRAEREDTAPDTTPLEASTPLREEDVAVESVATDLPVAADGAPEEGLSTAARSTAPDAVADTMPIILVPTPLLPPSPAGPAPAPAGDGPAATTIAADLPPVIGGNAPEPAPAPLMAAAAAQVADARLRGGVQAVTEGVSSMPSSLLVPQAVLAEVAAADGAALPQTALPGTGADTAAAVPVGIAAPPALPAAAAPSPDAPQAEPGTAAPAITTASPSADGTAPDADTGDQGDPGQSFAGATAGQTVPAGRFDDELPPAIRATPAQVALHVGKAAKAGVQRVEIALEPAALGRIDVRLDFSRDGHITAHFVAETREALDALRADARSLERALADAGVKSDSASLGFSLREQGGGGGFAETFGRPTGRSGSGGGADRPAELAATPTASPATGAAGRLDIRA